MTRVPDINRYRLFVVVTTALALVVPSPANVPFVVLAVGVVALLPFPMAGSAVNVASVVAGRPLAPSVAARERIVLKNVERRDRVLLTLALVAACAFGVAVVVA